MEIKCHPEVRCTQEDKYTNSITPQRMGFVNKISPFLGTKSKLDFHRLRLDWKRLFLGLLGTWQQFKGCWYRQNLDTYNLPIGAYQRLQTTVNSTGRCNTCIKSISSVGYRPNIDIVGKLQNKKKCSIQTVK